MRKIAVVTVGRSDYGVYRPLLRRLQSAPAFELPGSDGKSHSLADYRGRTVVLAWFPKAFTGG